MTKSQAGSLVAFLRAAYPLQTGKVKDEALRLLSKRLERFDYETARDALEKLTDTLKYWPSLAEITEAVSTEQRRRRAPDEDENELPVLTDQEIAENGRRLKVLRENLALPPSRRRGVDELLAEMRLAV
jgi:hypothetical protein